MEERKTGKKQSLFPHCKTSCSAYLGCRCIYFHYFFLHQLVLVSFQTPLCYPFRYLTSSPSLSTNLFLPLTPNALASSILFRSAFSFRGSLTTCLLSFVSALEGLLSRFHMLDLHYLFLSTYPYPDKCRLLQCKSRFFLRS